MRISLIQSDIKHGDPIYNYSHIKNLLIQAIEEQPDVVVLPEMWNSGYALDQLDYIADIDGQRTQQFLKEIAQNNAVNIIGGSVATCRNNNFYNTSYIVNRLGEVIHAYDKVHLFQLMEEHQYIKAGNKKSLFQLDDIPAAVSICYDIRFPEWLRTITSQQPMPHLLFVPAQWPSSRIQQWERLLQARAIENQLFIIGVNRVGNSPSEEFNGHSCIIDPLGNIIISIDNQEAVRTIDIDLSTIESLRKSMPIFSDRRTMLYQ
ncbi:carbon-nitrogen family hydrolase [Dolosigranulum savutiense]|uniref:Carbon-nitrogen family hydrolase n=1 Tax=Dolosigranulum savutiense TaxID=3110288 RepID=A0AB74TU69_9LACT